MSSLRPSAQLFCTLRAEHLTRSSLRHPAFVFTAALHKGRRPQPYKPPPKAPPKTPLKPPPEARQIHLPDRWEYRWLQRLTVREWAKYYEQLRRCPAPRNISSCKEPLRIFISDDPKQLSCVVTKDSILYPKRDAYARLLWKIASHRPLIEKYRWMRWVVYAARWLLCAVVSFAVYSLEQVSVSGRWRLRAFNTRLTSIERVTHSREMEGLRVKFWRDDIAVLRCIRKMLDQLTAQCGLVDVQWEVSVVHDHSVFAY